MKNYLSFDTKHMGLNSPVIANLGSAPRITKHESERYLGVFKDLTQGKPSINLK